jgi:hypothetical protein
MGDRLNLLYIASNGRSGSTLLDLLLGAQANLWTTGEFHLLPWELKTHRQPCGCGIRVEDCVFWRPIIDRTDPVLREGSIHRFRDHHGGGKVLRAAELPFTLAWKRADDADRRVAIDRYGRDNMIVLREVLAHARRLKGDGVTWVVDASKDLYRLLWLQRSGYFNIRVVHVVKDPRAFAYSMTKDALGRSAWRGLMWATRRWIVENYLINRVCAGNFRPMDVIRLRYEDLARHPHGTVTAIAEWLGVAATAARLDDFRSGNHAIAGNKMRYEDGGVRLDSAWRKALSPAQRAVVGALAYLPGRGFGYH